MERSPNENLQRTAVSNPHGSQGRGSDYLPLTSHFSLPHQGLGPGVGRGLGVGCDLGVGVGLGVAVGVAVAVGVGVGVPPPDGDTRT